jgi:RNA polymerase sigma-70 factor, ECF subfamily
VGSAAGDEGGSFGSFGSFGDEAALVAALRAGDERAFAWLLDHHDGPLRRFARTFVASEAAADEVVQETWLAVIEGIDRFEQRSSIKTWIYRILVNKARTRGVRDKRSVPFSSIAQGGSAGDPAGLGPTFPADRFLPPDHPEWPGHWASPPPDWENLPQQRLEARETLAQVRQAIDDLPSPHREVITLRDVQGWSSAEVCNLLDLTAANQRVVLHRARAKVRAALESYLTLALS